MDSNKAVNEAMRKEGESPSHTDEPASTTLATAKLGH